VKEGYMSAIGPDEHSSTQYSEASEQHNTAASGSEYDPNYEPEREFVLMPLFRRIGEMLGFRRSPEAEYVYQPEQNAPAQQPVPQTAEPQQEVVLPETAIQYSEPQLPAETQVLTESALPGQPYQQDVTHDQNEEDVLQLEPHTPHHASDNGVHESFEEFPQWHSEPVEIEAQPEFTAPSNQTADEPLVAARSEAPEMEPALTRSVVEEWPVPVQPASPSPATAPKRSPEEVRQLVAPLREAAVKITAIVAQAAEWLRAKEEEFLRSAETIAAESKREQQSLRSSSAHVDSRIEDSAVTGTLHGAEVPAVQRELAWREKRDASSMPREPLPAAIQFIAKPDRPLRAPSVPFWKRVNWAEEFTPKRVAVLGGLAMAVLLVLGISFARRPASSVLPEQQTRSLEPGGVTVTTHPAAAPVPPQVLRKASATERPSPVPQHRSRRATADDYDDGPDVIIHHYDTAKKPSPVKQTTVAGVRHYSDM
jgi:hypothetical protein